MPADWNVRNPGLAPLFLNNDLRIADAHELEDTIGPLRAMGFDTANVGQGYGRALDFVFDAIIQAFEKLNRPLRRVLQR